MSRQFSSDMFLVTPRDSLIPRTVSSKVVPDILENYDKRLWYSETPGTYFAAE